MGRFLTDRKIAGLAGDGAASVVAGRYGDPRLASDLAAAREGLRQEACVVRPLDAETVAGYAAVKDIYGAPVLVLRVRMPRSIYEEGNRTLLHLGVLLLVVVLLFGLTVESLLERTVITRLSRVGGQLLGIAQAGEASAAPDAFGKR